MMPVRAKRGAGSRDRKIGAGDDAERAVERHGQDAAQRGQRSPHLRMLHEISEVFVGRKAEPRRRAIDHGVHRIGERPAPGRDRGDDENLDGFLREGDPEYRTQGLRNPGVFGGNEYRGERDARSTQQRDAGGAEEKRGPHLGGRTRALVRGDHKPQDQQRRRHRCGSDDGRKGFKEIHRDGKQVRFLRDLPFEMRGVRLQAACNGVPGTGVLPHRVLNNPCRYFSAAHSSAHPRRRSYPHISQHRLSAMGPSSAPALRPRLPQRAGGLVIAGQPGAGVRYRFAFRRLGDCGLGQRANRDENGKKSHFNSFLGQWNRPRNAGTSKTERDYSVKSKRLPDFLGKMHVFAGCVHGAVRNAVGIRCGAFSGNMKVSFQAARSIG